MASRTAGNLIAQLLAGSAFAIGVPVGAADPCADPVDFVEVSIALKSATPQPPSSFIGEFEVRNIRLGKPIVLGGTVEKPRFSLEYPSVRLQFKDFNGQWQSELLAPGTFSSPKDRLTINPGETKSFFFELPSSGHVSAGGREFRILVLAWNSDVCVESIPFEARQSRGPVTGFVSAQRSYKSLERTRQKQSAKPNQPLVTHESNGTN
jgi:hypothetical protein